MCIIACLRNRIIRIMPVRSRAVGVGSTEKIIKNQRRNVPLVLRIET